MLFQPPRVVTVMEPWDGMRLPPDELFASLRREVATGRLRRGRLDLSALEHDGAVVWCRDGQREHRVDAAPDHLLGVKWPAFWRYLELLPATRFLVCLRDPAATVHSFALVGGRLSEGLDYETPFNRRMNEALTTATPDPVVNAKKVGLLLLGVASKRYGESLEEQQEVVAGITVQ